MKIPDNAVIPEEKLTRYLREREDSRLKNRAEARFLAGDESELFTLAVLSLYASW